MKLSRRSVPLPDLYINSAGGVQPCRAKRGGKVEKKMAGKIVGLVFEHFHGDAVSKLVFLTLADRADQVGKCWPSRADICARSGASPATVGRKLRNLERLGWIQRSKRFQASTVFRINLPRLLDFAELAAACQPVPAGFEPFPEELARAERARAAVAAERARAAVAAERAKSAQVIEKKDNDHCERKNDHCERKNDHLSDQLTVNNLSNNLSAFVVSSFKQEKSVVWAGKVAVPGSAHWSALAKAVKDQGL